MPFPADGVDVLNGMTERAKSARRDDYEPPRGPGGAIVGLGRPVRYCFSPSCSLSSGQRVPHHNSPPATENTDTATHPQSEEKEIMVRHSGARRIMLSLVCIIALAVTQLATAPPTAAAVTQPATAPLTTAAITDCGFATCSLYLSKSQTKSVANYLLRNQNAGTATMATAAAAACAATGIGALAAILCGGAGAIYGGRLIDQFVHASNTNGCIRIRYYDPPGLAPPAVLGVYSDHSKYCR